MIDVKNVSKAYGKQQVLEGLTFQVRPGEVYALLGPNGAGKTTTLRILAALVRPSRGEVRVAGVDPLKEPLEAKRRLGLVNGGMGVYDRLTGLENLLLFGEIHGLRGRALAEAVDWVTDLLALEETLARPAMALSTGMRKKLVIARAILHRPQVLLLDEATAGLDVFARRALLDFVKAYRDLGHTLLYSTHVMAEAEEVADRVGFLYQGRLVWEGPKGEAMALGQGSLERAFVGLVRETV